MNSPESPIRAALTRARVERVIARLPELSDDQLEGIKDNLFELAELRSRCRGCGRSRRDSAVALAGPVTARITTAFKAAPVFPNGRMRPSRLPSQTKRTARTGHSLLIRYHD